MSEDQQIQTDNAHEAPKPQAPKPATFDGPFDEERAARLIENLRAEISGLKEDRNTLRTKVGDFETANQTELEKATARAEAAEKAAKAAQHGLNVARALTKYGLDDDLAEFLVGDDEEAIFAKAERLAGRTPKKAEEPTAPPLDSRPRPGLTPANGAQAPAPFDAKAIAAQAMRFA